MVTPHLEHEPDQESNMDSNLVEDLTSRLPTSELVKIIKGALECGRRNVPFTETDLLRVVAFGAVARRGVRGQGGGIREAGGGATERSGPVDSGTGSVRAEKRRSALLP